MDRQGRDRKSKKGYTIKSMITKIIALILVFTFVFGSSFMQPLSSTADDNMAADEQTGAIEQETQESAEPETVLPLPEETQPDLMHRLLHAIRMRLRCPRFPKRSLKYCKGNLRIHPPDWKMFLHYLLRF